MRLLVIDLETTGVDPETDRVVEMAWCYPMASDWNADPAEAIHRRDSTLVNPGRDIPAEASAVHHLTNEDVKDAPTWDQVAEEFVGCTLGEDNVDAFVAHNSRFDIQFCPPAMREIPWIDTYRCALWAWPDAPRHTNQVLRYWLELDQSDLILPKNLHPHRALYDALTTAGILRALLRLNPVEQLLDWSSRPALLPRVTFGKFGPGGDECAPDGRGLPWREVRRDYLEWMLDGSKDWEEDVEFTANYYLAKHQRKAEEVSRAIKSPEELF